MSEEKSVQMVRLRTNSASQPRAALTNQSTLATANESISMGNIIEAVLMVLAFLVGAAVTIVTLPLWLPNLSASLLSVEPKAYWYLSRASAFVAYGLLWLSMMMGLLMTNKLARSWPGAAAAFDMHQYVGLLGLLFASFHALILLGDQYIGYTLPQLLVPFASTSYKPFVVGLGQVGLYVMALVSITFYLRRWIGKRTWRVIHFLSFAVFLMALAHGLWSGTDSTVGWVQIMYWASGGSVLFLTIYRMLARLVEPQRSSKSLSI